MLRQLANGRVPSLRSAHKTEGQGPGSRAEEVESSWSQTSTGISSPPQSSFGLLARKL